MFEKTPGFQGFFVSMTVHCRGIDFRSVKKAFKFPIPLQKPLFVSAGNIWIRLVFAV